MKAEEYLLEYARLLAAQKRLRREIESIEARLGASVRNDGMPHGSGVSDLTGALAAELADTKAAYEYAEYEAWMKRREIVSTINRISEPLKSKLLYDRYILMMRWYKVAADIHADESYTRGRLHDAALTALEQLLEEDEENEND